jgi:hypothetical protein
MTHPEDPFTTFYQQDRATNSYAQKTDAQSPVPSAAHDLSLPLSERLIKNTEKETTSKADETPQNTAKDVNSKNSLLNSLLVFIEIGSRHNLLQCLENLLPNHIIFYNIDLVSLRIIEVHSTYTIVHIFLLMLN